MSLAPFECYNFNGGMTDYYVDGPLNKFKRADNFLLVRFGDAGKLFTRPGSALWDSVNPQIPAGSQRIGSFQFLDSLLLAQSSKSVYYVTGGAWATLTGPTGNTIFPAPTATTSVWTWGVWNHIAYLACDDYQKPQKIYVDDGGVLRVRTAGLPKPSADVTITPSNADGKNYLYVLLYRYDYYVGTVQYKDYGPTRMQSKTNAANCGVAGHKNVLTAFPILANGASDNYDTAALKIEIYRTVHNGQELYYVGEVNNAAGVSFDDTVTDAVLQTNAPLYTSGGALDHDPPPLCKAVHVTENTGYYACVKEGTAVYNNRIRQSLDGDPDSCPAASYIDLEADVVGISSAHGRVLALCDSGVFLIEGGFDLFGNGTLTRQKISDTASCVSAQSAVQTLDGVFWAGLDGIYFSDGYRVICTNADWDKTYATFVQNSTQKKRIQGAYDSLHKRIYWTVMGSTVGDCDRCLVLDLNWGIGERMPFTTISGGDSFAPTSIVFSGGNLIRGDSRGYVFQHSDLLFSDPKVDAALAPANWIQQPIIYDYVSCATSLGTGRTKKVIPFYYLQCKNETNLSLQVITNNDDSGKMAYLKPVRYRGNLVWGSTLWTWGDPDFIWGVPGLIERKIREKAGMLRCSMKQVEFTNAYVNILNSDFFGETAVDSLLKTARLVSGEDWLAGYEGNFIYFEDDNYVQGYEILSISGNTLQYSDVPNRSVTSAGSKFQIKGYPKDEVLLLLGYSLEYAAFSDSEKTYAKSDAGNLSA